MAELERAALSGELFSPRSPSPSRSASTASPVNTDDELGSDLSAAPSPSAAPISSNGPQTGPKGVISDRRARSAVDRASQAQARHRTRAEQQKHAIVGLTVEEESELREREGLLNETKATDREREEDAWAREAWRARRREELAGRSGGRGAGSKGLRELGQEGFVAAVEKPGWAVVLIYEPDIPRCQALLPDMLHLSLNLPSSSTLPTPIALYRARASNLSFSLLAQLPQSGGIGNGYGTFNQNEGEDDLEEEEQPRGKPDPDVLPTLLAYRDGELEKTWIRVDWDLKGDGIEGLLRREGIIPQNLRIGQTDDGDLIEYE